ncbi:MAG: hypothetical protein HWN68_20150 [Desulfobacterales bacterium]|nr:hypothetical protein [Desulfobacterales bacterium]
MAAIEVTAAQVALVDPIKAIVKSYLAGSTITKGQVVAQATDGSVDPADASSGLGYLFEQVRGIALNGGGTGQAIDVLQDGEVYGFTIAALNCGALLHLSDDVGQMDTALGTGDVYLGRVTALADKDATKVCRIQIIFSEALAAE